jgi:Flp pilus assembly protein TadB
MTGRGLHGRRLARLILFVAIALDILLVLLFVSQPNYMSPMSSEPPSRLVLLIPAFGIALNLAGLAWMIRIVRADPEAGASSWRAFRRR